MTVQWASTEDLTEIVALERATAEAPHWPESEYRAGVSGGDAGLRRCLFVAKHEEKVLGFAVGGLVMDVAELESVAVCVSARRLGVGWVLCGAVVAWAWEHGANAVELEVRAESKGAQALYRRLGFKEYGRRRAYYRDPCSDAVLMRLSRQGAGL